MATKKSTTNTGAGVEAAGDENKEKVKWTARKLKFWLTDSLSQRFSALFTVDIFLN